MSSLMSWQRARYLGLPSEGGSLECEMDLDEAFRTEGRRSRFSGVACTPTRASSYGDVVRQRASSKRGHSGTPGIGVMNSAGQSYITLDFPTQGYGALLAL